MREVDLPHAIDIGPQTGRFKVNDRPVRWSVIVRPRDAGLFDRHDLLLLAVSRLESGWLDLIESPVISHRQPAQG
jgi:hypothetical protein